MKGPRLPTLGDTGRRYVENTVRARLASPGVERYETRRRSSAGAIMTALALAAALIGAFVWLS